MPAPPEQIKQASSIALRPDEQCCKYLKSQFSTKGFFDIWQLQYENPVDTTAFCEMFPCMCCECGEKRSLRPPDDKCPDTTWVIKLCCVNEEVPVYVPWQCCQEIEPPCRCCDTTPVGPCDLENCPPENRIRFRVVDQQNPGSVDNLVLRFSNILKKYGGYTCCEEYFMEHPDMDELCSWGGRDAYVNVCIQNIPVLLQLLENEVKLNNLRISLYSYGWDTISCDCHHDK